MSVLSKSCSGQLFTVPWWARGADVPWARRIIDVRASPAEAARAAAPCAAPHRPARGMSGFWNRQFLDMPCMRSVIGLGIAQPCTQIGHYKSVKTRAVQRVSAHGVRHSRCAQERGKRKSAKRAARSAQREAHLREARSAKREAQGAERVRNIDII